MLGANDHDDDCGGEVVLLRVVLGVLVVVLVGLVVVLGVLCWGSVVVWIEAAGCMGEQERDQTVSPQGEESPLCLEKKTPPPCSGEYRAGRERERETETESETIAAECLMCR